MLDAVQGEVQFFGVAAAEIVGVEVAGDDLRRYLEDLAQMPDRFGVEGQRFEVEQITDMLAENDGAIPSQAEGAFQAAAAAEDRRQRPRHGQGGGDIASRPAKQAGPAGDDATDRIVDPGDDLPVMQQEIVGDRRQPVDGIVVGGTDRGAADVAGGHHQGRRAECFCKQQEMERRIGQHDPDDINPRGEVGGEPTSATRAEQDDRVFR